MHCAGKRSRKVRVAGSARKHVTEAVFRYTESCKVSVSSPQQCAVCETDTKPMMLFIRLKFEKTCHYVISLNCSIFEMGHDLKAALDCSLYVASLQSSQQLKSLQQVCTKRILWNLSSKSSEMKYEIVWPLGETSFGHYEGQGL